MLNISTRCSHRAVACVADSVRYVVLDEADKMLGLGLQPQLERLRKQLLPLKRQAGQQLPGPIRNRPSARKRPQVLLLAGFLI